jgi:hypothetical protein
MQVVGSVVTYFLLLWGYSGYTSTNIYIYIKASSLWAFTDSA